MGKKSSKEKLIFNKENLINWIIGGIIALVLGKIFEPIWLFLYSFFLNTGNKLISNFTNSTYKEISNGYSDQSSSLVLYFILLFSLMIATTFFTKEKSSYEHTKAQIKQWRSFFYIKSDKSDISSDISDESGENNIENKTELTEEKIKKIEKNNNFSYILCITWFCLFAFFITFTYGKNLYILNKITVMTNNIEIVSPYISDKEYKELKSDFHCIESLDDYNKLDDKLNTIAEKNSLKLK